MTYPRELDPLWGPMQRDLRQMEQDLSKPAPPPNSVKVTLTGTSDTSAKYGWLATAIRKWLNIPNAVKEMQATVTLPKPQPVECRAPSAPQPTDLQLRRAATLDAAELLIACRERLNDDQTLAGMISDFLMEWPEGKGVNTAAVKAESKKITLRIKQVEFAKAQEAAKAAKARMKAADDAVKGKKPKKSPLDDPGCDCDLCRF